MVLVSLAGARRLGSRSVLCGVLGVIARRRVGLAVLGLGAALVAGYAIS